MAGGGPGGHEVGRISVRVVPNTSGFRRRLQQDLEAETRGIDEDVPVSPDLTGFREKVRATTAGMSAKVDVDADTDKAEAKLDRFQRRTLGELQTALSRLEPKIALDVDGERFRRQIESRAESIAKKIQVQIPVDFSEATKARNEMRGLVDDVRKLNEQQIVLGTNDQFDYKLQQRLNRLQEERAAKQARDTTEEFNRQWKFQQALAKLEEDINAERARRNNPFNLPVGLDLASTERIQQRIAKSLYDQTQRELSAAVKQATEGLRRDAEAELKAATANSDIRVDFQYNLRELEAVRAQAARALDGLEVKLRPDLSMFRVARLRIKQMLAGSGDIDVNVREGALSRVGRVVADLGNKLGDAAAGARFFGVGMGTILAIATLIPPAIALVSGALLTLPGIAAGLLVPVGAIALGLDGIKRAAETLRQPFEDLKTIMSASFEQGLTPVFDRLKAVFPTLNSSLPRVSEGLTSMADALVQSVTSNEGLKNVQSTVDNIGAGLTASAPGIRSFTDATLQLISSVSEKFPGLGESLSRLGDQFSGWIDKITTKDPASGVSQLDTALRTMKETIAPLTGAIGDLFTKGFDKLNDPAFAQGMREFTQDLRSLANVSFDGLSKFFTDINGAIQDAKEGWNSLPQGLRDFFTGENKPPAAKAKAGSDFWAPFTSPDAPWRKLLSGDEILPSDFATLFQTLWNDATKQGTELARLSAEDQKAAFKAAFSQGGLLGGEGTFGTIDLSTEDQKKAIMSAFKGGDVSGVTTALKQELLSGITEATGEATAKLSEGMQGLSSQFQIDLAQVGSSSAAQIQAALAPLQEAPGLVMTAFQGVGAAITGSWATVVATLAQGGSQMLAAASAAFAQLPGAAAQGMGSMLATVQSSMAQIVAAFASGGQQVVAEVANWVGQIQGALSGLGPIGSAAGAALGAGLLAGMQSQEGAILGYAGSLAGKIKAVKGPIPHDRTVLIDNGVALMEGLGTGMAQGFQPVLDQAKSMADQIAQAIAEGADVETLLGGKKLPELSKMLDTIDEQRKMLKVDLNNTTDKGERDALKDQMKQLQVQRDYLSLQKEKLTNEDKWGSKSEDNMNSILEKAADIPLNFARATGDQLLSDLNIGGGAITGLGNALLDWGINAGKKFIFNVGSMDDALAGQRTIQNREALQFDRR